MSLNANLTVSCLATLTNALDLATADAPLSATYTKALTSGTAAGQADRIWHDKRTIAASSTDDLDLAGSLTDALGGAFTPARVKGLIIAADPSNVNNVVVGAAAANGFVSWVGGATHTVTVRPGGVMALFAGVGDATAYTVTAATADILRIANSGAGTSVIYDVIIIGASV